MAGNAETLEVRTVYRHGGDTATSESRRRDLYNGLTEVLGIERADTLMQFLPSIEGSQQATRSDIYGLSGRIDDVERSLTGRIDNVERSLTARIDNVARDLTARIEKVENKLSTRIDRFEHSVTARFDAMNQRLDRIVLTLAAGLMAIIAALVAQNFM
jgi:L-serine deaminase